ncbi:hypothetical protein [Marinomonas ostreistagni]|uniref:hypothetical protein n=1 Tax=Marinomonas ostreistagni TaxID=359209 RepID=UPI00194E3790|nr:hypothetical protein [Marinomonas ostreistagni]MBM6551782.1 hypothetical protein [Marinomonas ostreistagni]
MKNYLYTFIGAGVALALYALTVIFDLELFEAMILFLDEMEHLELDEIIIPLVILIMFAVFDLMRRSKNNTMNKEKVKIYQAMVKSTHHILNNFLNQMLIVKMKAESTPNFDPRVLKIYDDIVAQAKRQIHALSNVTHVSEESIHDSVRPK